MAQPGPGGRAGAQDPMLSLTQSKREFGEFGGVNASIEVSTTFTVLDAATLPEIFEGKRAGCYLYGRSFNPTVRALSRQLAALEGTEAAYCCSSGMAAISAAVLALCNSGDHIVASNTIYGGTHALLKTFLPNKCGITTTFVDVTDLEAVHAAIVPGKTKLLYTETVSNPTLRVADLPRLAAIAHTVPGVSLVVDNTFTPFIITPAKHGADVVVHSMTKFISGASDIVAGCVCGSQSFVEGLMDLHSGPLMLIGPTLDPKVASELALRLPHLGLRMQEHSRRALHMAAGLEALGAKVSYPGLASHPQHELMRTLSNTQYGFGGLLGVDCKTPMRAEMLMQRLQNLHGFGFMAVSLGYFDTLMCVSGASTSSELSEEEKVISAISPGYVRMSIGVTGTLEQRWEQLRESWFFVAKVGEHAPFRAVVVKHMPGGALSEVMSWPSLGSSIDEEAAEQEAGEVVEGKAAGGAHPEVPPLAAAAAGQVTATAIGGDDDQGGVGSAEAAGVPVGRKRFAVTEVLAERLSFKRAKGGRPLVAIHGMQEEFEVIYQQVSAVPPTRLAGSGLPGKASSKASGASASAPKAEAAA